MNLYRIKVDTTTKVYWVVSKTMAEAVSLVQQIAPTNLFTKLTTVTRAELVSVAGDTVVVSPE